VTISTIAAAVDFLVIRDQPIERVGNKWILDGQQLSGTQVLALARQLDGGGGESKYGNEYTEVDGIRFASKAEAQRYTELRQMKQAGEIQSLELQPRYELQPAFVDGDGVRHQPIYYVGDFQYWEKGRLVCEDVKGAPETDVFKLKRKMLLHNYPHIVFRVVR
jgi:hypothetical protein